MIGELAEEIIRLRQLPSESLSTEQRYILDSAAGITGEEMTYFVKVNAEYERLVSLKYQFVNSDGWLESAGEDKDNFLKLDLDQMSEDDIINSLVKPDNAKKKILLDYKRYKVEYVKYYSTPALASNNLRGHPGDRILYSKYGRASISLPTVRGEISWGMDTHLEMNFEETPNLFRTLTEFNRSPKLGILLTKITIFVEKLNVVGRGMNAAEKVWQGAVMRIKETVDALGYYGKGIYRSGFMKKYESLQDDYVSEDIVTGFIFMLFGLLSKHVEYMKLQWRMPPPLKSIIVPLAKWAAGSVEFLLRRQFKRFLNSKIIPWNEKWGTIVSESH